MIEINLLPEELRKKVIKPKKAESIKAPATGLELKHSILLIPLILLVLILLHTFFGFTGLMKSGQTRTFTAKLTTLQPQRKELESFNSQYKLAAEDTDAIQQLIRERIFWSEKLNKLSLNLPSGVWFNSLFVNSKELILRSSAVSLSKEELSLIKQLIDSLKTDTEFFKDFLSLEMGSAEKRVLGTYDVTDFTLVGKVKAR
jgi:Tfp pilus assembly protein PilN